VRYHTIGLQPADLIMSFTFIANHCTALSRLFWSLFLLALLFAERLFASLLLGGVMSLSGTVLVGLAMAGRLWCALHAGCRADGELLQDGPYSMTRNPRQFLLFVGFVGVGLGSRSLSFALAAVLFSGLVCSCTIAHKARRMRVGFGPAFDAYCERTPCFFPALSLYREAEFRKVRPRRFLRAIGDELWLVWLVGAVGLADTLRLRLALPVIVVL
jgi:protein-S-isoprenylcysteine O-methyltransferase Ste14